MLEMTIYQRFPKAQGRRVFSLCPCVFAFNLPVIRTEINQYSIG